MDKNVNKTFAGQLKKAFITVILIPVLCLGGFLFYTSFSYIQKQNYSESRNIVKQNLTDLENRIQACNNSLRYLAANYELQSFLTINETDYLNISRASKDIGLLLYNVILTNQYYKLLTLYTEKELRLLPDLLQASETVKGEEWYQQAMSTSENYWWYEENKIFLARKIMSPYSTKPAGVIKVELKRDVFQNSFNLFEGVPVQVSISEQERQLYKYQDAHWQGCPYFEQTYPLKGTGWKITYQIDENFYNRYMFIGLGAPMLVLVMVLFLVWFLIYIFSRALAKDLSILVQEVNEVQKGELDIVIEPASITEINILAESIQNLLHKIKQLIRQVYEKEILRQELELNLLQSKISPHFLYNNLSAINWLALECGQDKIYAITTEMATFYRTALNKGKNIDKLSVEVANIKAYLNLKLISHEGSFAVEYQIDEGLLCEDVPIFIMQPLVENAIEHGIDQLRGKKGRIQISVQRQGDWMYFRICDNGTALFDKIGCNTLEETAFGYGTSNVHKRIQLLYGAQSGLRVWADEAGTTSEVRFLFQHLRWPI